MSKYKNNLENKLIIVDSNLIDKKNKKIVDKEFKKLDYLPLLNPLAEYRITYLHFNGGNFNDRSYSIYEYGEDRLLAITECTLDIIKKL